MSLVFFDKEFDIILYNDVISRQYPNLNNTDKNILFKYLKNFEKLRNIIFVI